MRLLKMLGRRTLQAALVFSAVTAQTTDACLAPCKIESTVFEGWRAIQISNSWVKVVIVPQLGGRVIQSVFAGHPYLFVHPEFRGKYFPPLKQGEKERWANYGGDKVWPLLQGNEGEHHWPGPWSDVLDDGDYEFRALSEGVSCSVRLDGSADSRTRLQYSREITVGAESPAKVQPKSRSL
jgi:hypothetical protein